MTPAFITFIVGGFGTYIAFNQYQTNKDKLRLDFFDKRLDAYEKLQEYFKYLVREAKVSEEALAILAKARYKSFFLFGNDANEHITEVWEKAREMQDISLKLFGENRLPVGEERSRLARRKNELLEWNFQQLQDSPKRYSKYLNFN